MNEFLKKRMKTILWVLTPSMSVGIFLLCHASFEGCPKSWHPSIDSCMGPKVNIKDKAFGKAFIDSLSREDGKSL